MSDFQHRHYAHIAAILADMDSEPPHHPDIIREAFAVMFRRDNPNFDWNRFMSAARGNPTNKDRSTARRRMGYAR